MDARPFFILALGALGAASAYALSRSERNGPVDGINWPSLPLDFIDATESLVNQATEQPADPAVTPPDQQARNVAAFLRTVIVSEGTDHNPDTGEVLDPYRVVMGYGHTLQDLSDHPYFTGEWKGAPFGNGDWSTAAGAYQYIRKTWAGVRDKLQLPDFGPESQDAGAVELIRERGALEDVKAGRFEDAIHKVRRVWASLPGAGYEGQPERSLEQLAAVYTANGGEIA